ALIKRLKQKPHLLISASAIGYYGAQDTQPLHESSPPNKDFTHSLCADWEQAAKQAEQYGTRLCIARLGVVLGKNGGALQKMLPAFKLGLGGRLGDGKQILSWIHRDDVVRGFQFLLNNQKLSGIFNFCAPHAISNTDFTKSLANALHRPAIFPMPAWLIKLLFGEMGTALLLHGQNATPTALTKAGFTFQHPHIQEALKNII
ncbi:MAG: TIGR01777 family oxidoreductase, partial [Parvibaculales bacterium]